MEPEWGIPAPCYWVEWGERTARIAWAPSGCGLMRVAATRTPRPHCTAPSLCPRPLPSHRRGDMLATFLQSNDETQDNKQHNALSVFLKAVIASPQVFLSTL